MLKNIIYLSLPVAMMSGCSGGSASGTTDAPPEECKIQGKIVDCATVGQLDLMRNLIQTFPDPELADSMNTQELIKATTNYLDQMNTILPQLEASEEVPATSIEAFQEELAIKSNQADTLLYFADIQKNIELSALKNVEITTLSEGLRKFPKIQIANHSGKEFRKMRLRLDLLNSSGSKISDHYLTLGKDNWEPVVWGNRPEFYKHYKGINKGIEIYKELDEETARSWDSTRVKLIRVW